MVIEVAEERYGEVLVMFPVGRLDSDGAPAFESLVMDRIRSGECRLVVDFSRMEFISSSCLRVLHLAARALKAVNGALVLCAMNEHIATVFQVSGFSQVIPVTRSREAALVRAS